LARWPRFIRFVSLLIDYFEPYPPNLQSVLIYPKIRLLEYSFEANSTQHAFGVDAHLDWPRPPATLRTLLAESHCYH